MNIKQQAREALKLDMFAKRFTCLTQCKKPGCECFDRYTRKDHKCVACSKAGTYKVREQNRSKYIAYLKTWHEDNADYVKAKAQAAKEINLAKKKP